MHYLKKEKRKLENLKKPKTFFFQQNKICEHVCLFIFILYDINIYVSVLK